MDQNFFPSSRCSKMHLLVFFSFILMSFQGFLPKICLQARQTKTHFTSMCDSWFILCKISFKKEFKIFFWKSCRPNVRLELKFSLKTEKPTKHVAAMLSYLICFLKNIAFFFILFEMKSIISSTCYLYFSYCT